MSEGRVERTERLLNLVFCLMATRRPVSRAEIQRSVPGYESSQAPAAFERMFERDKDELRSMGIPIETVLDVNGDVEGYRISPEEYRLAEIAFTPQELTVLALAASVWDEAILGPVAMMALRKLEAAQGSAVAAADLQMSVRVSAADGALVPLMQAVRERRTVTFDYRGASDAAAVSRRVDPWGVVAQAGRWYLVGHDHDRQAPRVFRLSRISGPVTVTAVALSFPRPAEVSVQDLVMRTDDEPAARAVVEVRAGRAAQLRRMAVTPIAAFESGRIEVSAPSQMHLIAALLGAGDGAEVVSPDELRVQVRECLAAVRDSHGGAA